MKTDDFLKLVTYAFHKIPTGGDRAFNKLLTQSKVHFHAENDNLTSMIVDTHFQVTFHDKVAAMSGIGYVASYPEYRGNGAVSDLMKEILRDNYENGTIFSYLAPFSYEFYGKFGYTYIFNQKHYEISVADFPLGARTNLLVKRLSFEEAKADLATVYGQIDQQGSLVRGDFEWAYYFSYKKQPHFALFYDYDVPKGYVIYDFSDMNFVIHELIFLDNVVKKAIYRFISSHAGAFDTVSYTAPETENLEVDMKEPSRAQIALRPYMMARLVNLAEFLKTFDLKFDRKITVIDDILPQNNLTFGEGDEVTLTIAELTRLVMKDVVLREYF
ncbi:acetyltransferase [Lactococcus hodotermopsidis]|uniref:Acetyltransferase n=1 Tax=Pseudolactococcus hodotermopsidis TaxID=2709157 RepID=A0A6A0BBA3_9LACT|nr:GNAT family N-acetyltransferase [Lactococcus hodotermopsidis]GFH41748.1 acetyltransferase [Lactococcus hodotermopsidis]